MPNTHINVGGHKITTNKVGTVHTVTTGFETGFSGTITWQVTNGICFITTAVSGTSTGINQVVYTAIPKAKIGAWAACYSNRGGIVAVENTTNLQASVLTANSTLYATLVYPVADDWVES